MLSTDDRHKLALIRESIPRLVADIEQVLTATNGKPIAGSTAQTEAQASVGMSQVMAGISIASTLIHSAIDHLTAFCRTANEPPLQMACWTCARGVVESSALGAWIMNPALSAMARASLVFSIRNDALVEHNKFAVSAKDPNHNPNWVKNKLVELQAEATAIGCSIPKKRMPFTAISNEVFGSELDYRLLSGVAHGQIWATLAVVYKETGQVVDHDGMLSGVIEQKDDAGNHCLLVITAVMAISTVIKRFLVYGGHETAQAIAAFDRLADALGFDPDCRPWRGDDP